jgi:alpha-L-arabinofuranosidase
MGRIFTLVCAGFVAPATTACAQNNTISVDATQTVRIVDERMFGVNATLWDPQLSSDQTVSMLRAAGIRTIRMPGGSLSNEYHWRTNTTLANTWTWASGANHFAQLVANLGSHTFLSVNYGSGTPEEAAAWVAYYNASASLLGTSSDVTIGIDSNGFDWKTAGYWADVRASSPLAQNDGLNFLRLGRSAPLGVKYWEIGNENYGSWETDQQAVKYDPYTYAVRAKDYIAKMKAVDSTIKIGAVVIVGETAYSNNTLHPTTNPRTGAVVNGWTPVLLATMKAMGVVPDFVAYHRYDQAPASDQPNNPEGDAKLLQSAKTWPADAANLRQQLTDYLGATSVGVEIVVTENNSVYTNPGKQSTSLVNGLFLADSVGNLLQTEINALTWWALRNGPPNTNGVLTGNMSASLYGWRMYGDYGMLTVPFTGVTTSYYDAHPTYYAMKLLSNFARGGDAVVQATSTNTLLTAFAARRTDGSVSVIVINKDPTNTLTADIALANFTPATTAATFFYGKPQDDAARTGSGSTDIATNNMAIGGATFSASFPSYSLTVLSLPPVLAGKSAEAGAAITLSAANGASSANYQWQLNGANIAGATSSTFTLPDLQPAHAGLYTATASGDPAIVGLSISSKLVGAGQEVGSGIRHPNGNIFDQILANGAALSYKADAGEATRLSFVDPDGDIVQIEFSGAGTVTVVFDDPTAPAAPVKYNQPTVSYTKGRAGIVVTGADETTNLSVFTVGRSTAFDPTGAYNILLAPNSTTNNPANNGSPLFVGHAATVYDGHADIAFVAITSANGKFGGLRAANAVFSAAKGITGIYAPGVQFTGPVFVSDIDATGTATPALLLGSGSDVRITGGDLAQTNGHAVKVSGFVQLKMAAGSDSHGNLSAARANQAVLQQNGFDVTTRVVVNP